MKTKRRHQLETNELADWLAQTYGSLRPYANHLMWGAVALAAIVLGASWLIRSWRSEGHGAATHLSDVLATHARSSNTEQQLADLRREYQELADHHPDTLPGKWARLLAADALRRQGMLTMTADRDGALASLRDAEREYRKLQDNPSGLELLDERALLGRAKALEALGDLNEARDLYQQLLDRHQAEQAIVEAGLGDPEPIDQYLFRTYRKTPPDDLQRGVRAGLVEVQQDGDWQLADENTLVQAGTKLKLHFEGLYTLEAKERLNRLADDAIVDFYAWLETAKLPPMNLPDLPDTSAGKATGGDETGIVPDFESEAPTEERPAGESPDPASPKDEATPPENAPQPDATPEKKAEDKPAEPASPDDNAKAPAKEPAPETPTPPEPPAPKN